METELQERRAEPSLAHSAVGGVAWSATSYLTGKLLVLASTVVLARLLAPRDFGLVALALVFISYAEILTDLGVAEALVFLPFDRERADHAVTLSLLVSGGLTLAALLVAPAVAGFFHRPDITTMFRVLSISLLLGGTAEVPDALLRKELRFRQRFAANLARVVGQGVISIALAAAGLGAWSLVYGYLTADLLWSAVSWTQIPYRPSRRFWRLRGEVARPLLAYGLPAAATGFVLSLVFDVDYLIVGRRLGAQALGFYTIAFRIPEMVIINVFYVLSGVAFPLFSRARDDPDRFRRGYLTAVRLQSAYGMAAVAPMMMHVVFGPKWNAAIVPVEALALYAAFRSVGIGPVDAYKGIGRPRLALWLSIARLALVLPALLIATAHGIVGVAWAQMVVALLLALLMQGVASVILHVPASKLLKAVAPAVWLGAGTAVGALAVRLWLPGSELTRLIAAVSAGGATGALALWASDRRFVPELRSLVARRAGPGS
jgi:lipopolysaccharide exporter